MTRDTPNGLAVVFVLLAGMATAAAAQAAPGRWVLVYAGGPRRPAYTVDDFIHLMAVVDTAGRPTGWLCDGALFLEFHAPSGRYYMPWNHDTPSTGDDWTVYLDSLFGPAGPLARLDSAAEVIGRAASGGRGRVHVAVMVPYPDPRADTLRVGGLLYSMRGDSGRAAAVTRYLQEVMRRFTDRRLRNLSLVAFYWLNERVTDADTALVPRVGTAIRALGRRFFWIPYYTAAGNTRWREFGFDEAWLQPNYFFHPDIPATRMDSALSRARAADMGLELEFDLRMFTGSDFADRLEPYLSALESAPDMRAKPITIYEGAGALIQLSHSKDPRHRALYERLVAALRPPDDPLRE